MSQEDYSANRRAFAGTLRPGTPAEGALAAAGAALRTGVADGEGAAAVALGVGAGVAVGGTDETDGLDAVGVGAAAAGRSSPLSTGGRARSAEKRAYTPIKASPPTRSAIAPTPRLLARLGFVPSATPWVVACVAATACGDATPKGDEGSAG